MGFRTVAANDANPADLRCFKRECFMKKKSTVLHTMLFLLVETSGLEPLTPCMSSKYSNQLSYASNA